jgi:hypothetical protein
MSAFLFDTVVAGKKSGVTYSTTSTDGCSCEQIIDELGLGDGHRQYGCSASVMKSWIRDH